MVAKSPLPGIAVNLSQSTSCVESTGDSTFSVLDITTKPSVLFFSRPGRKSNKGDSEFEGVPETLATKM